MNQSTKTSSRYNGVIGPDMNNVINVSGWTKRIFLIFFLHILFFTFTLGCHLLTSKCFHTTLAYINPNLKPDYYMYCFT